SGVPSSRRSRPRAATSPRWVGVSASGGRLSTGGCENTAYADSIRDVAVAAGVVALAYQGPHHRRDRLAHEVDHRAEVALHVGPGRAPRLRQPKKMGGRHRERDLAHVLPVAALTLHARVSDGVFARE